MVAYNFQVLVVGEKILRLEMFQGFMGREQLKLKKVCCLSELSD